MHEPQQNNAPVRAVDALCVFYIPAARRAISVRAVTTAALSVSHATGSRSVAPAVARGSGSMRHGGRLGGRSPGWRSTSADCDTRPVLLCQL